MILIFIEVRDNEILDSSVGLIDFACNLFPSEEVVGLLIRDVSGVVLSQLKKTSLNKILHFHDQRLTEYAPDAYAHVLSQVIERYSPKIIMGVHTSKGSDLFARVAANLNLAMVNECVAIERKNSKLNITKSVFGGTLLAKVEVKTSPFLITVKPSEIPPTELSSNNQKVAVEDIDISVPTSVMELRVKELEKAEGVDLTQAKIVVSGGRGVGSEEGFELLYKLADLLSGAVGGSRVAVDNGWLSPDNQVGQTGKNVASKLYIACGISGAIQHMVGCKDAEIIVAINNDPDAPIFSRSDYGIVGDLFEVIPELIEELEG